MSSENQTHITGLQIANLRGIRQMSSQLLQPLTIITGPSGSGKTTILDALEIYASRGHPTVIQEILIRNDDLLIDEDTGQAIPNRDDLFYNRDTSQDIRISTGDPDRELTLTTVTEDPPGSTISVMTGGERRLINMENRPGFWSSMHHNPGDAFSRIPCVRIGPDMPGNDLIARMSDRLSLTAGEDRVLENLSEATGRNLKRIGCSGDNYTRRPMVKIQGDAAPRNLRSMGSAALQAAAIALGLEIARGGFLLLDQADSTLNEDAKSILWKTALTQHVKDRPQVFMVTNSSGTLRAMNKAPGKMAHIMMR